MTLDFENVKHKNYVYSGFIHNMQKLETTQKSFNQKLYKERGTITEWSITQLLKMTQ